MATGRAGQGNPVIPAHPHIFFGSVPGWHEYRGWQEMRPDTTKIARSAGSHKMTSEEVRYLVIAEWGTGFCKSPYYWNLSAKEREESQFMMEVFTDLMRIYYHQNPPQWDAEHTQECCVLQYPRKIAAEPEHFLCIVPVLTAFFSYLDEEHLQKNAGAIQRVVRTLDAKIQAAAKDPKAWCLAKQVAMAAIAEDIDLEDKRAVEEFTAQYFKKHPELNPGDNPVMKQILQSLMNRK
ncbi:MAG: hypothetical protein WC406_06950 [Methanoregula sp.]